MQHPEAGHPALRPERVHARPRERGVFRLPGSPRFRLAVMVGAIAAILVSVLYIFAVMGAKLFGADYPQWFGGLDASLFTLFQGMTLEGWADIVREIEKTHPHAWAFFVVYILLSTFTVLNLFIAVIVEAMQESEESEERRLQSGLDAISARIAALDAKIDALRADKDRA